MKRIGDGLTERTLIQRSVAYGLRSAVRDAAVKHGARMEPHASIQRSHPEAVVNCQLWFSTEAAARGFDEEYRGFLARHSGVTGLPSDIHPSLPPAALGDIPAYVQHPVSDRAVHDQEDAASVTDPTVSAAGY